MPRLRALILNKILWLALLILFVMLAENAYANDFPLVFKIDGLTNPCGVAVDSGGNIYVANTGEHLIRKYNSSGTCIQTIGAPYRNPNDYNNPSTLISPTGLVLGFDGGIYVTDGSKGRLVKIGRDGKLIWEIKKGAAKSADLAKIEFLEERMGPADVAIDKDGSLFVVDSEYNRVVKLHSDGTPFFFRQIDINGEKMHVNFIGNLKGNSTEGDFFRPSAITLDKEGNIYVADTYFNRVRMFNKYGDHAMTFGQEQLIHPEGIAVDDSKNIFVSDTPNHRVVKFDNKGTLLKSYGKMGPADNDLFSPQKIFIKQEGHQKLLYLADSNYNRLRVFDVTDVLEDASVTDKFISPNNDEIKDTVGISFKLNQPASVKVEIYDSNDNLAKTLVNEKKSQGRTEVAWDGKKNNGQVATDGVYTCKISAAIPEYTTPAWTGTIILDATPPSFGLWADPYVVISPNGDGIKDDATVRFNLSDNLSDYAKDFRINAYKELSNGGRELVNSLLENIETQSIPYSQSLSWDGKVGNYVKDGTYIICAEATDMAGNSGSEAIKLYVDITPPRIENISVKPALFSPNNDGRNDETNLAFYINENISPGVYLAIKVADDNGHNIAILKEKEIVHKGEQSITWDGRVPYGRALGDGKYKLKIYAKDEADHVSLPGIVEVELDTVPPEILNLAADPEGTSPDGDGISDTTTFSFALSESGKAKLMILKQDISPYEDNSLYREEQFAVNTQPFKVSWTWDGKNNAGEIVSGVFEYKVVAEDKAGNIGESIEKLIYCYP